MSTRIVRGTAALALLVGIGCKHQRSDLPATTGESAGEPIGNTGDVTTSGARDPSATAAAPAPAPARAPAPSVPATLDPGAPAGGRTTIIVTSGAPVDAGSGAIDARPGTEITSGGAAGTPGDSGVMLNPSSPVTR